METRVGSGVISYEDLNPQGKQTVVILPGWGHSGKIWLPLAKLLDPQAFRVVIPDLPLFGHSSPLPGSPGIADYAQLVIQFLQKLELQSVVLVGHSFGAQVAVVVATTQPDLIDKLILVAPAVIRDKQGFIKFKHQMTGWLKILKPLLPKALRYSLMSSLDYAQATPKQQVLMRRILDEDVTKDMGKITQSSLIVWGERDQEILGNPIEVMNLIPQARLKIIYGAGHNLHLEAPRQLTESMTRWLQ